MNRVTCFKRGQRLFERRAIFSDAEAMFTQAIEADKYYAAAYLNRANAAGTNKDYGMQREPISCRPKKMMPT